MLSILKLQKSNDVDEISKNTSLWTLIENTVAQQHRK
jgi:hypothetical protein